MDPTMFLASPATRDPNRPDAGQIDAFYEEHGANPVWTRGAAAMARVWRLLSGLAREKAEARQSFAQRRLRMVD